MPIVKIFGMPGDIDPEALRSLGREIQGGVAGIPELELEQSSTDVFAPADLMRLRPPGEDVYVEVSGLFDKPERTERVRQHLADKILASMVIFATKRLPNSKLIEVLVEGFDDARDAFAKHDLSES